LKTLNNKIILSASLIIVFILLAIIPFPWNDPLEEVFIDLQFKLRGPRQVSDNIVVVFIGDEDLESLGSWPITRDYYSYAIHILNSKGAKVVALDVLFAQKDKYHPEYDQTLIDFTKHYGNVCLPMTFSELVPTIAYYEGNNPTYPIEELMEYAAGIGFSNFAKIENVGSVPLFALSQNDIIQSFGSEMARIFLGTDGIVKLKGNFIAIKEDYSNAINQKGCLRLNHFGSIDNVNSIGFVDLIQTYKNNPDSLNFNGKLVLISVSASGVTNFKSTPLENVFPASLVHLTVAENHIFQNYLKEIPLYLKLLILIILISITLVLTKLAKSGLILSSIILVIVYWIVAMLFFSYSNLILPLFYPTLAIMSTITINQILSQKEKQQLDTILKDMLQEQLISKENQLQHTKEKLTDLYTQLQQESVSKEKIQKQAEENKSKILNLEKEINDLKVYELKSSQLKKDYVEFENIIFSKNSKMAQALDLVSNVVTNDIPVLIIGDTGTGKEMIANAIHKKSDRKDAPFVVVNCGALSETLLESELFGHEKGSFTSAVAMRKGKFELADGGVIFLDEISETSPSFQSRLLRVLQESNFERVGGEKSINVDVRVIAATNRNLQDQIEQGKFRSDLFYRLNGFPIMIPPLKQRTEDIPLLAECFLKKHKFDISFSKNSMNILKSYSWPGNVRELENVVRRAAIMASSANHNLIQEEDITDEIKTNQTYQNINSVHVPLDEQILESLRLLKFSRSAISQTAKALGNKDRGTITEYFRGICFQHLVNSNFNISETAQIIAKTDDKNIVAQVELKINEYLNNLKSSLATTDTSNFESLTKGLPKKYHEFLKAVVTHLSDKK
jgi:transcriptional regulator with GAF, ATPase, and Fis domain